MFEKKAYIVSSTFGICRVEKVTKLVVGREQQMEYYVLQSVSDKNKKSYIPVEHHETVLRNPMEEKKAEELLQAMVINGKEMSELSGLTLSGAKKILEGGDPENWAKAAVYYYTHQLELDAQMREVLVKIWENLQGELAFVLKKSREEIRQMVEDGIK